MKNAQNLYNFVEYFLDFYGPNGCYPETIPNLKLEDIYKGISLAALNGHNFAEGDTFDREKVRDMILEHVKLNKELAAKFQKAG